MCELISDLYDEVKRILRWNYPGMESYIQDIWILLANKSNIYDIKKQILTYNRELGMGAPYEGVELDNTIQALLKLRPSIQKYSKLAMEEKKLSDGEIKRLKALEDELNSYLKPEDRNE